VTADPTCAEVREAAAELVLGTLDGERRAATDAHLATCAACRREVEELTRVSDALWLLAPEAEPPAGFESRVLRAVRLRAVRPRRPARSLLAVAAVSLLLAAGLFAAGLAAGARQARPAPLAAGRMYDTAHVAVGRAVVSGGTPSYVYVALDAWQHSGDYVVEVVRDDGTHVAVGTIRLTAGRGAAGAPLTVPYGDVSAVWVTDAAHTEWCGFRL
jgi:anti-sigma factor RsiW